MIIFISIYIKVYRTYRAAYHHIPLPISCYILLNRSEVGFDNKRKQESKKKSAHETTLSIKREDLRSRKVIFKKKRSRPRKRPRKKEIGQENTL